MTRKVFQAASLVLASVAVGCGSNGTFDGQIAMRCYQDITGTAPDGSAAAVRQVYKEFMISAADPLYTTRVDARLTQNNEFQYTLLLECASNDCLISCGQPPAYDDEEPAAKADINVDRMTLSFVVGREETAGVDPSQYPFYQPAWYYRNERVCLSESGSETLPIYSTETQPLNEYADPQAYSAFQLNGERSVFVGDGRLMDYAEGAGTNYSGDEDCLFYPTALASFDAVDQVVDGGSFGGTIQAEGLTLGFSGILVDIVGPDGYGSPATFTVDGLIKDRERISNPVSSSNDPWELDL